ncbi:MAG: amidohydrolase family protein [Gemmatimonadales bacterium]|nr:amidohydrolase family protein [Gemmatimonadota bacterium]MCL4213005.1 amidohydrolase family protein [Gemmatimonadales bacterium]
MRVIRPLVGLALLLAGSVGAQQSSRTEPITGLRDNGTGFHALVGARVVTAPGQVLENATIVVRNGLITAVGRDVRPPAGARVWQLAGQTVYPGFIDAHADLGMDAVPQGGDVGPTHWNPQVRAWYSTTANFKDDSTRRSALRSLGFGTALVVPKQGIFRGKASVVNLGDAGARDRVLRADLVQAIGFNRSFALGGMYPNSSMGTIALMKQTFMDAEWYIRARAAYEKGGRSVLPPETSEALAALGPVVQGQQPVLFQTESEEDYLRAQKLAAEYKLVSWYRGNGQEYRLVDVLKGRTQPLIVPLNFPDAPDVSNPEAALGATLGQLRHWYLAPTNPSQLSAAGIPFAITTDGLSSITQFLPNLRIAVARGLAPDKALASLTTVPAGWLGIDRTHGTIAVGKVANLVVADGDLFTTEASIRDVWVQGTVYGVTRPPQIDPRGTWTIATDDQEAFPATLRLEGPLNRIRGTIEAPNQRPITLASTRIIAETGRLEATFNGEQLGYQGTVLLSGSVRGEEFFGWMSLPNGTDPSYRGTRTEQYEGPARGAVAAKVPAIDLPFVRPSMEYGRSAPPPQPAVVLVRNATVWTQGPQGKLENADLLVRAGKIVQVGKGLTAPSGATVIDGTGKHVTPGLIDPHTHSGVSSVNESGFAIVPEVQMGDVLTHNNIWFYRQLAGGLTSTMIKHGSANPIGGENVYVKIRWGSLPDDMKIQGAPRTVKFALGENPKRSPNRYPNTRMGTQEIIRDHFRAARDYEAEWKRWNASDKTGIPPRKDLRMEALLDILNQKLLVSSHGYRADEFLALVRLAEEFGFRIQTLQHGVEAYKIATELANSGVAAIVWSDWGAFKLEAYDATGYNARLLIEAGVVTSLHSDDSEISTRMNWEAGKLLRTGLTEEQALSTVTNGSAKAIKIEDKVGSLEAGKDADFVIWSGNPLSQFTKAEQTWVDGRRYFSLEEDAVLRAEIAKQRTQLIQAVHAAGATETPTTNRPARAPGQGSR